MSILSRIPRALLPNIVHRWGKGLGRVQHYDPRSDAYRIEDVLPKMLAARLDAGVPAERAVDDVTGFKLKRRAHRAWRTWDQGSKPFCTSYGSFTCMSADPVRQPKRGALLGDPDAFFAEIQQTDRAEGRVYSEGATGLAAMKAAVKRGWFGSYLWTTNVDTMLLVLSNVAPVMCGTFWRRSMFERDAEGIIRVKPGSPNAGGHWYCCTGFSPKTGLIRISNTWGDGSYYLPADDMRILAQEDAEIVLARELVVSAPRAAPAPAAFAFEDEDDGN